MTWCRLWDEFIDDEKLVDCTLQQSGAFARALSLANKCRREGKFVSPDMIGVVGDVPLSKEQIIKRIKLTNDLFEWLNSNFFDLKDETYSWRNWPHYQGDSERIKKHQKDKRRRKK